MAGPTISENLLGKKSKRKEKLAKLSRVYPVLRLKEFERVSRVAGPLDRQNAQRRGLYLGRSLQCSPHHCGIVRSTRVHAVADLDA
jgi:hypothetical protein